MALIQCHFDYACSSWFSGLNKNLKCKLQVAQNKIFRFIKNMDYRSSVKYPVFQEVGFLNVENRVRQLRLSHVHKIMFQKCPSYMKNNFVRVRDCHSYCTRSSEHNFFVPPVQGMAANTFYYNAIKDWNSLPSNLKNIKNHEIFKKGVKDFLFEKLRSDYRSDYMN